jgi:hypothetical protein
MTTAQPVRRERGKPLRRACRHQLTKPSDPRLPRLAQMKLGGGRCWTEAGGEDQLRH